MISVGVRGEDVSRNEMGTYLDMVNWTHLLDSGFWVAICSCWKSSLSQVQVYDNRHTAGMKAFNTQAAPGLLNVSSAKPDPTIPV